MAVMISFRTLSLAKVHPRPARKPDCLAEKVQWDLKWSVICLLTWLSKTLERQGRIDIGQFGSRVSPPLKRGMTTAAFQSLGISDNTKERLNRLVIGVLTISADHFRKRGSRLSSPADLWGSRFYSSFRPSAIWMWVEENWGRFGQVAGGGAGLLTGVEVARWKAWPAVEKCFLKFSIVADLSVVTVFLSLSAVGSWEQLGGGALFLHGLYSIPERS